MDERWRARIPADIDRPEPLIGPLTARQLLLLAPVALGMWAGFMALRGLVPLWGLAALAVPVAGAAIALAAGRRDGVGLDAFAGAALAWAVSPKRRAGAPEGVPALPQWSPRGGEARLEPLRLPASAIGPDGVVDLDSRCAALVVCSTINLSLVSAREQDGAVAAFAGVLDSLADPVQVLVQSRAFDLAPFTERLREGAPLLPHPALEEAARDHADFLHRLQMERDLVCRYAVVTVTASGTADRARRTVLRRAEDVAAQLSGIGIRAQVCDREMAEQVLQASLHVGPLGTGGQEDGE